jgi:6-phosphogluconolactonase
MVITRRSAFSLFTLMLVALLTSLSSAAPATTGVSAHVMYVGTYNERGSKGIYAYSFDQQTGALTPLGLMGESRNPSFLALDKAGRHLYAVNEVDDFSGKRTGAVSAFTVDPATHKLTLMNQVDSGGAGPAHLSIDNSGKYVLVANYDGGSIESIALKPDGSLGDAVTVIQHKDDGAPQPANSSEKARVSHAHYIKSAPDNRFVTVNDLGLDRIFVYKFDAAKGTLTPNAPPYVKSQPGAGPRHFKFHPNGRFAYAVNELNSSVTAYSYDGAGGILTPLQTLSAKPDDFTGKNDCSELVVHSSGKFLYAANRGHDSIAVFSIDPRKGTLTLVERVSTGGKTPRNFNLDPTGRWLIAANQDSDNMTVFRIDQASGKLTPAGKNVALPSPVCIVFAPSK